MLPYFAFSPLHRGQCGLLNGALRRFLSLLVCRDVSALIHLKCRIILCSHNFECIAFHLISCSTIYCSSIRRLEDQETEAIMMSRVITASVLIAVEKPKTSTFEDISMNDCCNQMANSRQENVHYMCGTNPCALSN